MKLHEAIEQCAGQWFRPVNWHGVGQAYTIKDGRTHLVPSAKGGVPGMTADAETLMGEWEVVTPQEVLGQE